MEPGSIHVLTMTFLMFGDTTRRPRQNSPVLVMSGFGLPTFSPLDACDESRSGEFKETEAEQVLYLGPDPLDRFSVESGTVQQVVQTRILSFHKKDNDVLGVIERYGVCNHPVHPVGRYTMRCQLLSNSPSGGPEMPHDRTRRRSSLSSRRGDT